MIIIKILNNTVVVIRNEQEKIFMMKGISINYGYFCF